MSPRPPVSKLEARRGVSRCVELPRILPAAVGQALYSSWTRGISLLIFAFLLAATILLLMAPPASADLPRAPDDSAEANGRVWDILRVGDRIYLAGNFTQVTNTDGTTYARNNLAAIDANTGNVVPDWDPNATRPASPSTSSVRTMALSADGSRIFVGGTFANVGGLSRNRLAAIDLATGTLDKTWGAGVNSTVWALAVSENGVYAGGDFTTVKSQARNHLAKLDATTGTPDPNWTPSADQISNNNYGSVRALAFSEDESRLYVGGYFQSISGQQTGNLVALEPATGVLDGGFRPNDSNGIQSMAVSGGRVFVGTGDPLEGIEAFDGVSGALTWRLGYGAHTPPEGDVQAITVSDDGSTVYAGGHFNRIAEYARHRLVAVDAATGLVDAQWSTDVNGGNLGVWAVESYGPYLYAGGDFTSIAGRPQARFAQYTDGPDRPDMGLTGQYFDNIDFTGATITRTDATVNYDWTSYSPNGIGPDTFSARWSGEVKPAYSETYTFYTTSDDGVRLWVDDKLIVDNWTDHAPTENQGTITLAAGQLYDVRMEYYERGGGAVAKLWWSSARQTKQIVPQSRLYPAVLDP
jgi:hypothetical protein